ncbi:substrate-binding domain-containing protein [Pseudochelatococcus lubricantis]|uniref:substrate-binding domain-containing protein n=1 Tax=Pseudochelatococcus lubricantis TaxID=1538102 RepID=UPI0035EC06CB
MRKFIAAFLCLLALAACSDSTPPETFAVVAGSENRDLEPIVQEFCTKQGHACSVTYLGSLDIGLSLADAEPKYDAVWPAASIWISIFDQERKVRHLASIAQNPVVLGVRESLARDLGWIGRDVSMADIVAAIRNGKLGYLMTSATQSNSGASAYLAMLSAAVSHGDTIRRQDLDDPAVTETVRTLLRGIRRSAGSSGWLADLYLASARQGVRYDGMWNYEVTIRDVNNQLRTEGKELLYAIYPTEGVAVADSPLGFVDRKGGQETEAFFLKLQAHLTSPEVQKRIAESGRRLPFGSASTATPRAEPEWNFNPEKLISTIRMPEPGVIRQALDLYQGALRRPSITVMCLDYSGSMQGDGEQQLREAMSFLLTPEQTKRHLVQWSPQDRIVIIPFDGSPRAEYQSTGAEAEQGAMLTAVNTQVAGGGTDIYACATRALQRIDDLNRNEEYLPAIVIMSDGKSQGGAQAFRRAWDASTKPPVFGITFADANEQQLKELADETGGRVFDGRRDLIDAFRSMRGYN